MLFLRRASCDTFLVGPVLADALFAQYRHFRVFVDVLLADILLSDMLLGVRLLNVVPLAIVPLAPALLATAPPAVSLLI